MAPADALIFEQGMLDFFEDIFGKAQLKRSSTGLLEERCGESRGREKGADQGGGVKDSLKRGVWHVVF